MGLLLDCEYPCLNLRKVEQVRDETVHPVGRTEDRLSQLVDAVSLAAAEGRSLEDQRGPGNNGAERVSQVVRNDGEQLLSRCDSGLGLSARDPLRRRGALEGVGFVLELCVGVSHLSIHSVQLELPRPELIECTEKLDVLQAYLLHRARRSELGELGTDLQHELRRDLGRLRRQRLPEFDRGAMAGNAVGAKGVHQPPGAQQPHPQSGRGLVMAGENGGQIGDAGATVADADNELLGRGALDGKLGASSLCVQKCIACNLGDCGRDARLLVGVELEERGNLPRPLAHQDDVRLRADIRGEEQGVQGKPPS